MAQNFYLAGVAVTIQVAAGTYAEDVIIPDIPNREGTLVVDGGNAVTTQMRRFTDFSHAFVTLSNITVLNDGESHAIFARWNRCLFLQNVIARSRVSGAYSTLGSAGIVYIGPGCSFEAVSGYGVDCLFQVRPLGYMLLAANTVVSGAATTIHVCFGFFERAGNALISGSITGQRYLATQGGQILTGGGGANFFPGTIAGATSIGGFYS